MLLRMALLTKSFFKSIVVLLALNSVILAQTNGQLASEPLEIVRYQNEYSAARLEPVRRNQKNALAVMFQGTDDIHYYANEQTAPGTFNLKVQAKSETLNFGEPIFPSPDVFYDKDQKKNIEVYVGQFTVFVPIDSVKTESDYGRADINLEISGLACTSKICLAPFKKTLKTTINLAETDSWKKITAKTPDQKIPSASSAKVEPQRQKILPYGTALYYLLAIVAGISINLMPCVLPVIPLIMMRLIKQAEHSGRRRITSGMAFCAGVILFFATFAVVSAIINISTGAVIDLNSLFRYPAAVILLFLAIIFFALVMLDVVTFALPSSVTGKGSSASGIAGSTGMGFFAGILSTPCSGALLGFVLVWAQTQTLLVSSIAIVLMGVGMALPYAVIVLIPSLLKRIPKPGNWMEIFKQTTAFLLFFIAVKLTLAALPKDRLINVLIYGIIFSFCLWMWGKWVSFSTPAGKKWTIRLIALVIAVVAGFHLLPAPAEQAVDWQKYDAALVKQATMNGRPVLLKFTADWCASCKVVDKKVYQDQKMAELLDKKNVLTIKADTTLNNYPGEAGNVPVTIVILPNGKIEKIRGTFDKKQLAEIIEKLPDLKK